MRKRPPPAAAPCIAFIESLRFSLADCEKTIMVPFRSRFRVTWGWSAAPRRSLPRGLIISKQSCLFQRLTEFALELLIPKRRNSRHCPDHQGNARVDLASRAAEKLPQYALCPVPCHRVSDLTRYDETEPALSSCLPVGVDGKSRGFQPASFSQHLSKLAPAPQAGELGK
jgi:hypothetical protein